MKDKKDNIEKCLEEVVVGNGASGGDGGPSSEDTTSQDISNDDSDGDEHKELENEDGPNGSGEDEEVEPDPSATRDVFIRDGCYLKRTRGRNPELKLVSNITLQAQAKVVSDDDWFYQCLGTRNTGQTYDIKLFKSNFLSASSFKGTLSAFSDIEFYGNNYDTTQIQGLLADQNPPVIKGTDRNGMHLIDQRLFYVEGDTVVDKDGPTPDLVYTNRKSQMSRIPTLFRQPDISDSALRTIAENLNRFNDSSITYPILGFIGYCFVKEAISSKVNNRNPFLLCQGEPGTGKSETISRVIIPIFGNKQSFANIGSISERVLALNLSSTNMIPACYDEFKPAVLSRSQQRIIDNVLLSSYAQTSFERGKPDKTIDNLRLTAPLVLAGEVTMNSPSLNHRRVEVFFSYGKRKGNEEYFRQLIELPLESFGKGLLHHTLQLGATRLCQEHDYQDVLVDAAIKDRFRDNAVLIRTGLWLIIDYLESSGIAVDCYKQGFDIIDSVIKESINAAKINNVDKTIADFCTMANTGVLQNKVDYEVKGSSLRLKIATVYAKYERWTKRNGTSELIGKRSFLQQLDGKEYFICKKTARIGGKECNAIRLDLSSIPESLDIDWPGHEPSHKSEGFFDECDGDGNDSEGDDEPWKYTETADEDYQDLIDEVSGVEFRDDMYNCEVGFTAMKDGEFTLSGHLHQILYNDQCMEEEVILDELWKRGWNPTDHHNERVIKMLLSKSPLFRKGGNGWYCPDSCRRYY